MAAEVIGGKQRSGGPTPLELRDRPWHVLSGRWHARLDELVDTDVWTMDEVESAETTVERTPITGTGWPAGEVLGLPGLGLPGTAAPPTWMT